MEKRHSAVQGLFERLYAFLCPYHHDAFLSTSIHTQGRFAVFALSQIGALIAAVMVLYLYGTSSCLITAGMGTFMAAILLNCLFIRWGISSFKTAALVFAAAVFCFQALLMLSPQLQSVILYGFFPSVIGGFFFLGTRMGSVYTAMFVALLTLHALFYQTTSTEYFLQLCAMLATFMIAFFYETASTYHMNILSVSLERMTDMAKTDQLTGIVNRWEFFHQAEKRIEEAGEGTMMMVDLDDFKSINDTYGHAIGDQALKSVAQTIKSYIRESELFGRIGGEEFAILLPVGIASAYERAESIRQAVSQLQFNRENVDLRLRISIGLTPVSESDTSVSEVLSRADKGLYQAKKEGKNKTVIWRG